jgi:hypothetical protein
MLLSTPFSDLLTASSSGGKGVKTVGIGRARVGGLRVRRNAVWVRGSNRRRCVDLLGNSRSLQLVSKLVVELNH